MNTAVVLDWVERTLKQQVRPQVTRAIGCFGRGNRYVVLVVVHKCCAARKAVKSVPCDVRELLGKRVIEAFARNFPVFVHKLMAIYL